MTTHPTQHDGVLSRLRRAAGAAKRAMATSPDASAPADGDDQPELTNATTMFHWCLRHGGTTRPQYLWPLLNGARVAKALGHDRVAALEFGVAGGNGLVALEAAAEQAESLIGITVDVYGFDTGAGMPAPIDHRDVPWIIQPGWFAMDIPALKARLRRAELVIGNVADTVASWSAKPHAPIGFVSFDLDYYSSTMDAFKLLDAPADGFLPRVNCYFDDMFGYGWNDYTGERAAIIEFNEAHPQRKIAALPGLRYELPADEFTKPWPDQIYLVHLFDHPAYNESEGPIAAVWHEAHRLRPQA